MSFYQQQQQSVPAQAGGSYPRIEVSNNDPLPPGWEMRYDNATGWPFFIDHTTKQTSWSDPRGPRQQPPPPPAYPANGHANTMPAAQPREPSPQPAGFASARPFGSQRRARSPFDDFDSFLPQMPSMPSIFSGGGGLGGTGGGLAGSPFGDRFADRFGDRFGSAFGRSSSPMNVGSARMSPDIPAAGSPAASSTASGETASSSPFNRDTMREKVREIPIKVMRGVNTLNNNSGAAAAAPNSPRMSSPLEGPSREPPKPMPPPPAAPTHRSRGSSQSEGGNAATDKPTSPKPASPNTPVTKPTLATFTNAPGAASEAPPPESPAPHDPSIPIPLPPSYHESSAPTTTTTPTAATEEKMEVGDDATTSPTETTTEDDNAPPPAKKMPVTAPEVIEDVREKTREFGAEIAALPPGAIAKTDKQYLYLEEMLMRQLIRLDNVETEGKEEIRAARKLAVKEIQAQISQLEQIGGGGGGGGGS